MAHHRSQTGLPAGASAARDRAQAGGHPPQRAWARRGAADRRRCQPRPTAWARLASVRHPARRSGLHATSLATPLQRAGALSRASPGCCHCHLSPNETRLTNTCSIAALHARYCTVWIGGSPWHVVRGTLNMYVHYTHVVKPCTRLKLLQVAAISCFLPSFLLPTVALNGSPDGADFWAVHF